MDSHYQNGVIILSDSLCELHLRFDKIFCIQTVKSQRKTIVCTLYGKFTINQIALLPNLRLLVKTHMLFLNSARLF